MKKFALIVLVLCLLLIYAVSCTSKAEESRSAEPSVAQVDAEAQIKVAPEQRDLQQLQMDEYAAYKDELFEGLNGAFTGSARVEGTLLVYTYTFYDPDLCRDTLHLMFEKMCEEGPLIIAESQNAAPAFTGAVIQFKNAEGEILDRREF